MSWSRRALLLLLLPPLAACGFSPLYAEREETEEPGLAAIKVLPIKDRIGQMLEMALRGSFNPRDRAVDTQYTLAVTLSVSRYDLGIQRDATATRGRVDVYATMELKDAKTDKVIYTSRAQSTSSFNILDDAYSAQVAEDDARVRTVRDLTDEIRARMALFLRSRRAVG
jgi:LPS-assembly lipoprotein